MKHLLHRLSLSQKLAIFILGITVLTLLIPSVWMGFHQLMTYRDHQVRELTATADVLGANCAASLRFEVADDAELTLSSLAATPHIEVALLYTPDGQLFASYSRSSVEAIPEAEPSDSGYVYTATGLTLTRHIQHDGDYIGTLVLKSGMESVYTAMRHSLIVLATACGLSCLIALVFTYFYLGVVSRPLRSLVDTSTRISETGDYSLRAEKFQDDDLGNLTDRFNRMIEQIQERDAELVATHAELERGLEQIRAEQWALKESRERELDLREQLSRSERMESLGVLAGGVAHDLNNILGPVVGYPDLILMDLEPDSPFRDDIQEIQKSALKAAAIIQDLLSLGRRGNYDKQPLQLNHLVQDYFRSAGYQALTDQHANLVVRQQLTPNLPPIDGSPHHLSQVVLNLTINAVEAMGGEGALSLWTQVTSFATDHKGIEIVPAGEYVELSIRDNGAGIAESDLRHIFEPFYTRKKMGRSGSGLGLAVVYGVVKDLDGFIDVESTVGEGTRFRLFFPPSKSKFVDVEIADADYRGSERILIVDDVAEQRNLATRILASLGYETQMAVNGREAVKRIESESFDLVLLDMIMEEDFDGLDTFRAIRACVPRQRCVVASGFSESHRVKAAQDEGAGGFVAKPYTRSVLARAVRAELDHALRVRAE